MRVRSREIEREAAEALLDRGVSVPLTRVRLPLTKKVWTVRVTMRRPRLGGLIRIAELWRRTGSSSTELAAMDAGEQMAWIAAHGKEVSQMIACTLCRGVLGRRVLGGAAAWAVRHLMETDMMAGAMHSYVGLLGTRPFESIIRSAERMNPLLPRLSRERKGS